MKRAVIDLKLKLTSDAIFSSGQSIPGGEDIAVKTDKKGMPYLAGATFKGLLLENMKNLLCWQNEADAENTNAENKLTIEALFGKEERSADTARRLILSDFSVSNMSGEAEPPVCIRCFTALEDGIVKEGSLRMAACIREGTEFRGSVICAQSDTALVKTSVKGIKELGLLRNRGFGSVEISVIAESEIDECEAPRDTHWLHYRIRLITPLSVPRLPKSGIAWEKRNFTETKTYLPGSAVRGMVISALARENPEWFSAHKTALFGEGVRFLNAYPQIDGEGSVPSPQGFYEDKAETRFYSVLTNGEVTPGDKRAKIGKYCCMHGGLISAKSPSIGGNLRIKRGEQSDDGNNSNNSDKNGKKDKKEVFTVRTIAPGTVLEGYIYLEDASLTAKTALAFKQRIWLGADRYAGCGLCKVESLSAEDKPYWEEYSASALPQIKDVLTMLLLSSACMIKEGEPVGIDCEALAKLLGVQNVEIIACASSVIDEGGFNRTFGCALPTDRMYKEGSVFKLRCTPAPSAEKLRFLEERGIGIRRNEGFGQILFLSEYDGLKPSEKQADEIFNMTKTTKLRRARCRWLLESRLPAGLSKSQMGNVQALLEDAIEQGGDRRALNECLEHNLRERGAKHGSKFGGIKERVNKILDTPLSETLGTETFPDTVIDRMRLICDWIDLSRKGEAK